MKRYWKSCLLVAAIFVSIGGFYIQSAYSASKLPDFFIKKQDGNSAVIEPVVLQGMYKKGEAGTGEVLEISSKGTDYRTSFFDQYERVFLGTVSEQVKKLQQKYRGFMRGKNGMGSYYEDEIILLYAEIDYQFKDNRPGFTFQISALDKKGEKETSFELAVPQAEKYSFVEVQDVQMSANQLKIVTKNNRMESNGDGQELQELHVYTFDLSGKRLLSDDVILSEPNNDKQNVYADLVIVPAVNMMAPATYIVYKKVNYNEKPQGNGEVAVESSINEWFIYNIQDNKEVKAAPPKDMEANGSNSYVDGSTLYLSAEKDGQVLVVPYNIEDKKAGKEVQIPFGGPDRTLTQTAIKNSRIYLIASKEDPSGRQREKTVIVANLKSGKTLYKGTLENKKADKKPNGDLIVDILEVQ